MVSPMAMGMRKLQVQLIPSSKIFFKDVELQPQLPVLITGDLNADLEKLEAAQDALDDHHIYDVGAIASAGAADGIANNRVVDAF